MVLSGVTHSHYMYDVFRALSAEEDALKAITAGVDEHVTAKFAERDRLREEEKEISRKASEVAGSWSWWHALPYGLAAGATALGFSSAITAISTAASVNSLVDSFFFNRNQEELSAQRKRIDGRCVKLMEDIRTSQEEVFSHLGAYKGMTELVAGLIY